MKNNLSVKHLALALTLALVANVSFAESKHCDSSIDRHESHLYGKTLGEWTGLWTRWWTSGADSAQNMVGRVQLLPAAVGGYLSGVGSFASPAVFVTQSEVTLKAGSPFVIPVFVFGGERYNPVTTGNLPDDPPFPKKAFLEGVDPIFTIDGKPVVTEENKRAYYVPSTPLQPIVVYPAETGYGSIATISYQGMCYVGKPLPVGVHVIHLSIVVSWPAGIYAPYPEGFGVIEDATWVVTVAP